MDAVKFLKEMERMCDSYMNHTYSSGDCMECPFSISKDTCLVGDMCHEPEKAVEIVEQWSKERPQKTYKDDFLEKFPNADRYETGLPMHCRNGIYGLGSCASDSCEDCWNEPMEG